MIPANRPRDDPRATRLLRIDPRRGEFRDGAIGDLRTALRPGDLLIVNDAATLPASLAGTTPSGAPVEARLAGGRIGGAWRAVLFGAGDWHARTEDRPPPPRLSVGDAIRLDGVRANVASVDERSPRLVSLTFDIEDDALWRALYRAGRPVQYSYLDRPLAIWDVQTAYAARPWAAEAPSTGFALTWDLLIDLRRRGVGVARVTHAAGLSSTGDAALDALLPFPEAYEVTEETALAVARTHARGGRVVAAGTTVVRALEGAAADDGGRLAARAGTTSLVVGAATALRVVDGIVTGVHEEATSHFRLLEAFAPRDLLLRAHAFAEERGFRDHEFGDAMLLPGGDGD